MMTKSVYCPDGTCYSLCLPINFLTNRNLSMVLVLFRDVSAQLADHFALVECASSTPPFPPLPLVSPASLASRREKSSSRSPNSLHFPICSLTILSLGAILTTTIPLYIASELPRLGLGALGHFIRLMDQKSNDLQGRRERYYVVINPDGR